MFKHKALNSFGVKLQNKLKKRRICSLSYNSVSGLREVIRPRGSPSGLSKSRDSGILKCCPTSHLSFGVILQVNLTESISNSKRTCKELFKKIRFNCSITVYIRNHNIVCNNNLINQSNSHHYSTRNKFINIS